MVKEESCRCTRVRVFFWNEKLTRNQISEWEGLCVIIIRRNFERVHRCPCYSSSCHRFYDNSFSTVIPFDLSRLLNKDPSLFSMLLSATLQFTPKHIIQMSNTISSFLFTKYHQFPQLRSPYVIALEISQNFIDDAALCCLSVPPPIPIPSFCRFQKDWDVEEEHRTSAQSVSTTDYMNDPYHSYCSDDLEYLYALREYTGEGGICPAKLPIAPDLPKGLNRLKPSPSPTTKFNDYSCRDLMDDACPVCYSDFKHKNEVITTNCMHEFHMNCLLTWLSKNNTCPTCRAVYPLHYAPDFFNCRKRSHHSILKEPNSKHQHMGA